MSAIEYIDEMKRKTQICIIHGGMTFTSRDKYVHFLQTREILLEKRESWTGMYLEERLGKQFEIIRPRMPLADNAVYTDWKIHFERYLPYMPGNIILIGNSLGGIFLAKYLSEQKLPRAVIATYLVCAPFDNTLEGEELVGGFTLKSNLSLIEKNTKKLHLLFSEDDDVVPISHAEKYTRKLPSAQLHIYTNKNGHFNISKFPEIIKMIQADVESK